MLANAAEVARAMRELGVTVMHAPISFAPDGSDNPQKHLGILGGCDGDRLFTRGTWNAAICDAMAPQEGDVVVVGKTGLSAFPDTNLEALLRSHGVETLVLGGFMANCCVESTMREAYEKGFNVITLTDCVATTSAAGYKACVEITYPFFSMPMNAESFIANVKGAIALEGVGEKKGGGGDDGDDEASTGKGEEKGEPPVPTTTRAEHAGGGSLDGAALDHPEASSHPSATPWALRSIAGGRDVYQVGPWFVDVRQSSLGEKIVMRSGEHELERYLTFAEASGAWSSSEGPEGPESASASASALPTSSSSSSSSCALCDAIYTKKMPSPGESTEPFGWLCNMTVVRLPLAKDDVDSNGGERGGGCVLYSPVLDANNSTDGVMAVLREHDLLPVRVIIAPSPQHHLALAHWQAIFPDAYYVCGRASGQMPPLTKKRRDVRFDAVLSAPRGASGAGDRGDAGAGGVGGAGVVLSLPKCGPVEQTSAQQRAAWEAAQAVCRFVIVDDNR